MTNRFRYVVLLCLMMAITQVIVSGQDDTVANCDDADLEAFIADGTADLEEGSTAYIYRLGELYTEFALLCGYQPTTDEIITQIDRTLAFAPLSFIIAQSSIGNNVDAAMAELETVNGDSFNGQLLYNGLEMGLDGADLGCAGCHNGEAAPLTEGTFTRVDEIRLADPEFADYTVERYLVESILHPSAYIVPEYEAVQMPENYGGRLDAQQLADLVAYLESQDQLLDEIDNSNTIIEMPADLQPPSDSILRDYDGDAVRGEGLYNGVTPAETGVIVACTACHLGGVIGPDTVGSWTRINEERLTLPEFEGYTAEEYIIESIIAPNDYIVPGYSIGIMPPNYSEQLSEQDLADLIAYIQTTG